MSDDIVLLLRKQALTYDWLKPEQTLEHEAADELVRLQAENERLKRAIEEMIP